MEPSVVVQRFSSGEIVAEKYRVAGLVGTGGYGQVFAAENINLGTRVAIKVPRTAGADGSTWREARAAARLRSPHTVRILDVDGLPDGTPYIVMELLEGQSLRQYLNEHGRVPWRQALDWTRQLCVALKEAHAIQLVHRDIKPSNVFLVSTPDGATAVKLLDFGLSKALDASGDEGSTESGKFAGSPGYMSPEQVRGLKALGTSDIWALGVVLYEMLAGKRPFVGEGNPALFAAIVADQPTPLVQLCQGLPASVGALAARCLRKAPHERAQSVEQLEREIQELFDDASSPPGSSDDETESGLAAPPSRLNRRSAASSSRWRRFGAPILLATAAVGLLLALRELREPSPPEPSLDPSARATRASQPGRAEPAPIASNLAREPAAQTSAPLPSARVAPAAPRVRLAGTRSTPASHASTRAPDGPTSPGSAQAETVPPTPVPTFFEEPDF